MRMELENYTGSHEGDRDSETNMHSDHNQSPSLSEPSSRPSHQFEINPNTIPDSVRGAPEELKPAIRKKQNKESARRSRRRRKELVTNLSQSIEMLLQKTQELESRLESMERFLSKSGYEAFPQPRLKYPVMNRDSDGGPSLSGSLLGGSDGGSRGGSHSLGGSQSGPGNGGQGRSEPELEDEDVERLIACCLEQL